MQHLGKGTRAVDYRFLQESRVQYSGSFLLHVKFS
jgi:hypothetical protein